MAIKALRIKNIQQRQIISFTEPASQVPLLRAEVDVQMELKKESLLRIDIVKRGG